MNIQPGPVLLTAGQLATRVAALGEDITRDFENQPLLLVGILKGAAVFLTDLMRCIPRSLYIDFLVVSSYDNADQPGELRFLKDLQHDCAGKHVILVEDIIDTGLTLTAVREKLKDRGAASISTCCLLDKPSRRRVPLQADYVGFTIPDVFVVGYGLDFAENFRNLPAVHVVENE